MFSRSPAPAAARRGAARAYGSTAATRTPSERAPPRSPPRSGSARRTLPKHEGDDWRAHYARYLRFYADAFEHC